SVGTGLKKAGYAVDVTGDGEDGLFLAQSRAYDAIILDLMLPSLNGMSLLRRLRSEDRQTHILILTARDTVEDRVRGLHAGADDYLVKPFAFDELLARVQALCRRAYGNKAATITVGKLEIDTARREVTCDGEPIALT